MEKLFQIIRKFVGIQYDFEKWHCRQLHITQVFFERSFGQAMSKNRVINIGCQRIDFFQFAKTSVLSSASETYVTS
jgi:hypothetical protein